MDEKNKPNQDNRNVNTDSTRVLYIDDVLMAINNSAVVIDFGQRFHIPIRFKLLQE